MFKFYTLLLFVAFLLPSCVEKRDLSSNNVVIAINYSPEGLHPTNTNSSAASFICTYTQRTLINTDLKTEEYFSSILTCLPQPDSSGLIYTYEIKEGVYWDNGEPLTVEDVIFSTKLLVCPLTDNSDVRPIYNAIVEDVIPDDTNPRKFYLICKSRHICNIDVFSEMYLQQKSHWDPNGVLNDLTFKTINGTTFKSKESWDDWFTRYNDADNSYIPENLVGLGPYQVTAFEKDNYILLEKKKNWWGSKFDDPYSEANPEKIIFKIITDNSAVYLGIKNQEIDYAQSAGGVSKLIRLRRLDYFNENYHSEFISRYSYNYIGLNMRPDGIKQKPLFTDVRVRKALAYLVPVDELIEVLSYGKASRQASIVSPLKESCDTTLAFIPFDIEKAKQLLKEAGWEDTDGDNIVDKKINGKTVPLSFKLNYPGEGGGSEMVLIIKDAMKSAGVELIPNPMDFNTLYKNASDHTFDAMLGGWLAGSTYSDPTQLWSTESWTNKGSNFTGFGNAYSDSLLVAVNTTLDPEGHLEAYRKFQKLVYDEQPYIFLYSGMMPAVVHKRFENTEFYRAKPNLDVGGLRLKTTLP